MISLNGHRVMIRKRHRSHSDAALKNSRSEALHFSEDFVDFDDAFDNLIAESIDSLIPFVDENEDHG